MGPENADYPGTGLDEAAIVALLRREVAKGDPP